MLSSVPALLLPPPSEPLVLLAARTIAANLASGEPITRRQLHTLLTDHFGGTDADGRWSVRDAHIALELAQTEFLQATPQIDLAASAADADRMFTALESVLPTQTRSEADEATREAEHGDDLAARALEKIGELHESGIEGGVGAGISRAGTGERHQRGQDVVLELGTPGKLERGIHEAGPFED